MFKLFENCANLQIEHKNLLCICKKVIINMWKIYKVQGKCESMK